MRLLRSIVWVLVLALLVPVQLWAAVAFDARSEGEGATGMTVSHVVGSGSNRALYACVTQAPGGGADVDAVTATYGGVASSGVLFTDITTHGSRHARVIYWLAPASGTANIALSWAGGGNMRVVAASFDGVDQVTPHDAQQTVDGSGGGTSSTVNVTSATNNMVMDCLTAAAGVTAVTVGAGQTEINQMTGDSGPGYQSIASSYEAGSTTTTMSWSWTGFSAYVGWAWDLNAASAGGATCTSGLAMMGAGGC